MKRKINWQAIIIGGTSGIIAGIIASFAGYDLTQWQWWTIVIPLIIVLNIAGIYIWERFSKKH